MPENTTNASSTPAELPRYLWFGLAALIVFVYFYGLGIPLLGPDEPRYTQVAREMFERGDWITPMLGGHNWFEKPALLYWLQITSFKIFGIGEFPARLGSALFGLATVGSLWCIGRTCFVKRTPGESPNWLALIAASSLGLLVFARGASFDIIITFPITAAMASFFAFDRGEARGEGSGQKSLILFYFFCGAAVLAKGLIGIVFPLAIVTFYYLISWRMPSRRLIVSLFWGLPVTAAVMAVWYVPMYTRHGWEFVDEFIIQHHFQRFTSNKYQHPQPFFFFWWVLPLMTLPWLPFFFAGAWKSVKGLIRPQGRTHSADADALSRFSLAWMLVPLVFFSLSGSKLPGYILPSLPPAIILAWLFLYQKIASRRWRFAVVIVAAAMFTLIVGALTLSVPKFADKDSVRSLIERANELGYGDRRVLMVYHLSHNAEFYAAGRLLRDETGKQRVFYKAEDLLAALENEPGRRSLVLVPIENLGVLTRESRLQVNVLKDNTELAIVAVGIKDN